MTLTGSLPSHRLAPALLAWYETNRRDLPWRKTQDPYRITVAEFMLTQTRVTTVLRYYERFLQTFPDWSSLATARLDDVLKAWEGMGYYARARNLHRLAQEVQVQHGGRLPDALPLLLRLPGIGTYTAGAILSIAFRQDVPAIDGNARRVLCRVFHIVEDPSRGEGACQLLTIATAILPQGQAAAFNQGLMDLATAICTPRRPACDRCPLAGLCEAQHLNLQEALPIHRPRKPLPHYTIGAAVIWNGPHILITQRVPEGLLGGLWEFPGGKREPGESLPECVLREVREELGVEVTVGALVAQVEHAYTHFRITLHVYHCQYVRGEPHCTSCAAWKWATLQEMSDYAFPAANRRVIAALLATVA